MLPFLHLAADNLGGLDVSVQLIWQRFHILQPGKEEGAGVPFKLEEEGAAEPRRRDDDLNVLEADPLWQMQHPVALREHVEWGDRQLLHGVQEAVERLQALLGVLQHGSQLLLQLCAPAVCGHLGHLALHIFQEGFTFVLWLGKMADV